MLSTEEIAEPQQPYSNYRSNVLINVILRRDCANHYCRGKAKIVTHSECVSVASVTQYANRMRRIILLFVACLAVPYLPH